MRIWHAVLIALTLAMPAATAQADQVVTLCSSDDQDGAGMNLVTAITLGGKITFACGDAATIAMNCHHEIVANTEIDGAGKVTLKVDDTGAGCGSLSGSIHYALFHDKPAQTLSLTLSGLRIIGVKPPPMAVTSKLPGQFVFGNLKLSLVNATVSGWSSPIAITPGSATLDRTVVADNDGAVLSAANLTIANHSEISGNEGVPIVGSGGPIVITDSVVTGNKMGSKLAPCSTIDIRNSRFDSNVGAETGGALTTGCDMRIANTTFANNQARTGGALYIGDAAAHTNLIGVTFEGNSATAEGGAIALRFEIFPPIPPAQTVELHGSTFRSNSAAIGGAISIARGTAGADPLGRRTLTASGSDFIDNHASIFGGALVVARADVLLSRTLFMGNSADKAGGAIVALQKGDGIVTIANSLLVRNASPIGAAIAGQGVSLVNSTVADNDGPAISGAATVPSFPPLGPLAGPQPIRLHNSIVAAGTGTPCGPADAAAPYLDLGNNLQNGGSDCGVTIPVGSPQFGPSYIPLPTGPAAHGGDDAVCASNPIGGRDIWGKTRPYSGHCAIGSAEPNIEEMVSQAAGSVLGIIGTLLRCACLKQ